MEGTPDLVPDEEAPDAVEWKAEMNLALEGDPFAIPVEPEAAEPESPEADDAEDDDADAEADDAEPEAADDAADAEERDDPEPEPVAEDDAADAEDDAADAEPDEQDDDEPDDDEPDDDEQDDDEQDDDEQDDDEQEARDPTRVDLGSNGDYGLDAPGVVRTLAYVALGAFGFMVLGALASVAIAMVVGLGVSIIVTIVALAMVSSSRTGKVRERVRIVHLADLQPDDYVLDLGCGRGLVLVEAARHVPDGLAVGVDVWSLTDQSRNEPTAPLDNAVVERVADHVVVVTADGRGLPYPDGSFDAVVSSMVLHNIGGADGPVTAVREAARVLRPGGRLVLVDMRGTRRYVKALSELGWRQVARSRRRWGLFPPVRYVTAAKPDATPATTA